MGAQKVLSENIFRTAEPRPLRDMYFVRSLSVALTVLPEIAFLRSKPSLIEGWFPERIFSAASTVLSEITSS